MQPSLLRASANDIDFSTHLVMLESATHSNASAPTQLFVPTLSYKLFILHALATLSRPWIAVFFRVSIATTHGQQSRQLLSRTPSAPLPHLQKRGDLGTARYWGCARGWDITTFDQQVASSLGSCGRIVARTKAWLVRSDEQGPGKWYSTWPSRRTQMELSWKHGRKATWSGAW